MGVLTHAIKQSGGGGPSGPTPIRDTTNAKSLLAIVTYWNQTAAGGVTDSFGNTWTARNSYTQAGSAATIQIFDSLSSPIVGAGHTAQCTAVGVSFASIIFISSTDVLAVDQQNGAAVASGTTINSGPVTPLFNNEFLLYAVADAFTGTVSADGAAILLEQGPLSGGNAFALAGFYEYQTTATLRNPQFTDASSARKVASIASYQVVSGGPTTAQFTQLAAEAWAASPTPNDARFTQLGAESWAAIKSPNDARFTQLAPEVWAAIKSPNDARFTQLSIEVWARSFPTPPPITDDDFLVTVNLF